MSLMLNPAGWPIRPVRLDGMTEHWLARTLPHSRDAPILAGIDRPIAGRQCDN